MRTIFSSFVENNANPAPYIFKNEPMVVLACNGTVFFTEHWSGPYVKIGTLSFRKINRNRTIASNGTDRAHLLAVGVAVRRACCATELRIRSFTSRGPCRRGEY